MQMPTIVVTHDLTEAMILGDTLAVMEQGKVSQVGLTQEVVNHPASVALARIVGFDTILSGEIISLDDDRTTVKVGRATLVAAGREAKPGNAAVCIRAEDVRLIAAAERGEHSENSLPAVVSHVVREGHHVRVRLDCGFPLIALVAPHVAEMLRLEAGSGVTACVTHKEVHLIPS
jgi:ABC-type sulfate/molybdate transport systems ATPase subunit